MCAFLHHFCSIIFFSRSRAYCSNMTRSNIVRTFDEAEGGLETLRDGLNAATDEGHFETVVVTHQHRWALVSTEDADVARLTTDEDCDGDRVHVVTPLTAP